MTRNKRDVNAGDVIYVRRGSYRVGTVARGCARLHRRVFLHAAEKTLNGGARDVIDWLWPSCAATTSATWLAKEVVPTCLTPLGSCSKPKVRHTNSDGPTTESDSEVVGPSDLRRSDYTSQAIARAPR